MLVPAMLTAALAFAAVPQAQADPKRGSTGQISGPSLSSATKTAPKASSKASSAKSSSSKSSGRATSKTSSGGLGVGSKGPAVVELQTLLQAAHYDITDITGTFGDQTFHAVMAFQKANGLPRTGRAGVQTVAALREGVTPEPIMPDGGPDRVEVSIPKQYLALYRGGALIKILSVSTGSGKDFCTLDPETGETGCDTAITPPGSFRVGRRVIGWRESKLGLLYNPLYFNGGIALHGAPSVPANPASHGCVRVPMVSADYLPTVVPDGIPVYVSDGIKQLKPISSRISPADAWVATPGPSPSTTVVGPTTTVGGSTTTIRPGSTTSTIAGASTTTIPGATTSTVAAPTPTVAPAGATTSTGLAQTTLARTLPTTTIAAPTTTVAPTTTTTTRPL